MLYLGALFLAKVLDNALSTTKTIPVHPIRHTTFRAVMLRFCHCKRKSIPRR